MTKESIQHCGAKFVDNHWPFPYGIFLILLSEPVLFFSFLFQEKEISSPKQILCPNRDYIGCTGLNKVKINLKFQ